MPRDYKHRVHRAAKKKPIPVFVWLVVGYLLGISTMLLVWFKWSPEGQVPGWINQDTPITVAPEQDNDKPDEEPSSSPRFDFYTMLPEMEVVVPDDELEPELASRAAPPAPAESSRKEPAKPTGPGYLLQVGSFRNAADADRVKASLILSGFPATISSVKTSDGKRWNRVRVGPVFSAEDLRKKRKQLATAGYKSLVIRVRP